jgi:hypothetical protein
VQALAAAPGVQVLITSRIAVQLALPPGAVHMLELQSLTAAAAADLVQVIYQELSGEQAAGVARACKYQPLVLQLVGGALASGNMLLEVSAAAAAILYRLLMCCVAVSAIPWRIVLASAAYGFHCTIAELCIPCALV